MRQGFSLVELSIVLVILGLLVGGVLTGQSLIRAAELRSVTTEFQKYQAAAHTFRDKYFALPGDMTNATLFWGAMTNCAAASPSGTGTQTCDGNGDGQLNVAIVASQTSETFGFWVQLANAGLIEGKYTGIVGPNGVIHAIISTNVPASKVSNGGWTARWLDDVDAADVAWFEGHYGNILYTGAASNLGGTYEVNFTPQEAWNIDSKMDDGKPKIGKIVSRKGHAGTGTAVCSDTATREYALTNTDKRCSLIFLNAF